MDITRPLALLGGLTPAQFMQRHWQREPLLVRRAIPGFRPLLARAELFGLAGRDEVESRLVAHARGQWQFRRGPFTRRALPPLARPAWTLLVQGVDLHRDDAHELLSQFRFVPQARLDDLMISYATDGGGVGPHFDSYDVFLLQAQGRRRWRVGRQRDLTLLPDLPLKILARFEPQAEYVLEPGDLLYLPPRYAHDGVAMGECQTYSIGFRAPAGAELARELLQRLSEAAAEAAGERVYRDARHPATGTPGAIPGELQEFARAALAAALREPGAVERALGEYLSEPKPNVWFESVPAAPLDGGIALDRRTRMIYDAGHVFINGESWRARGRDAALLRRLADRGRLEAADVARAGAAARALLASWQQAGWVRPLQEGA